jgi:hypothetical protein
VRISPAARGALERLLAWKLSLHGVSAVGRVTVRVNPAGARYSRFPAGAHVSLPHISGHRDGDATDCPGNALSRQLPRIRRVVHQLAGRPVKVTLALAPHPGVPSPQPSVLTGAVMFLGGAPVAGTPVLLQARNVSERGENVIEQTLAQVVTGAGGEFSLPVSLSPVGGEGSWLRALCPGGGTVPAAVSEPLNVPGAVSVSPASAPAPTPPAPAPPAM